jgi:hypothetical protein
MAGNPPGKYIIFVEHKCQLTADLKRKDGWRIYESSVPPEIGMTMDDNCGSIEHPHTSCDQAMCMEGGRVSTIKNYTNKEARKFGLIKRYIFF